MFKRIDHIEVVSRDLDKSLDFYIGVLGFKLQRRYPVPPGSPWKEVAYVGLGDTTVELLGAAGPLPGPAASEQVGYRMMAIEVEDMDKAIKHLKSHGVEVSQPPMEISRPSVVPSKFKRAEIKDPNGLSIELRQW